MTHMDNFHAKEQIPGLLDWMRAQMRSCGGRTAVVGISGGKDSSVIAALCCAAYGKENVVGVLMPNGVQPDIDYSNGIVDFLGIRHYVFNIQGGTDGILDEMARVGIDASRQTKVNLPSRIRMATLYAIAQSVDGGIVINTSNLSEDWVGYCTIYGDSAGAFSPIGMYTTEEVIAIGYELGLPEHFLIKPPSDGLTGLTDEDNLGFTYHAVNEYVRRGVVEPAIKEQIDRRHALSRFKFQTLPLYQNGLPIVPDEPTDYYNPNKK
ncbi:MAG: NAD(+) synthase [Oscillospiraceae bacterium]|nr:NAD(+) synthase [Oscillospiraceae bacterium]